ncbi:efflux transporter outer membrane subunit [Necropsobacter massiliensis]|uniref:efflux transporter outer membrane subunit n=1 Tax=Necropsobacter massiliensis TaxID=1400001 RepID=UPI0005963A11|nr:efflux transporter outer membrane subunit [Necropsobacter massiliensis]
MKKLSVTTISLLVAVLTACQNTDMSAQSSVRLPPQFEHGQKATGAGEILQWWRNWRDPQLTRLIEQGLANNLDVALAQSRLSEAQANSRAADADRGPSVSAVASGGWSVTDLDSGRVNPSSSRSYSGFGALVASWEPDFFGQKRSDADAAQHVALSYQEQVYAAQLLVASQIAENYFKIYATEQQSAVLKQNISSLQQLQRYIKGRFVAGDATAYEVNEINSQISALQAKQATLQAQADSYQRNIAVLLGQPAQGFRVVKQGDPLAHIPTAPSGQQPGNLVERRPDIRANAQQIQAAMAKVASAKADLYPRFDITFAGHGGRIELNNDLSHVSGLGSLLSLGVQLPIFTNGRIQANIDAADARLKGALIQYDKTLLTALSEVDSAYQMQYSLTNQTRLLQTAYQQAEKQARDAQALFRHGEKTLDVALRAQISALNYRAQIIESQLNSAQNLINLYKALGGGWQP